VTIRHKHDVETLIPQNSHSHELRSEKAPSRTQDDAGRLAHYRKALPALLDAEAKKLPRQLGYSPPFPPNARSEIHVLFVFFIYYMWLLPIF